MGKFKSMIKDPLGFTSFLKGIKNHVTEGAKALANISVDIFDEVKEKSEEFYEAGSEKFEQAAGVVYSYVEKFNNEKEIKDLSRYKEFLNAILGDAIYHEYKKSGTVSEEFLSSRKMQGLFESIEDVDKNILKVGKKLETELNTEE